MKCTYCNLDIVTDAWDWGWYWEEYVKIPFHMECVEVYDYELS